MSLVQVLGSRVPKCIDLASVVISSDQDERDRPSVRLVRKETGPPTAWRISIGLRDVLTLQLQSG